MTVTIGRRELLAALGGAAATWSHEPDDDITTILFVYGMSASLRKRPNCCAAAK
jgi:hypothetical protein